MGMFTLSLLSILFLGGVARAVAYLDPGSGSFFIQLLVAGLMGALFLIGVYWKRVKTFFMKMFGRSVESSDGDDTE
jgi:Na+/proline symporter